MVEHRDERSGRRAGSQARRNSSETSGERVAKALARAGVASRRDIERYIAEGRVSLNGEVLDSPAVKVAAGDVLLVDGKVIDDAEPTRLWRYHKPVGLMTTHKDPHERPTVFSALPADMPRVISVGRLDINSEGLLLLTNDGGLTRALELPSSGWVRRYRARARGRVTQERLDRLKEGVTVEGVSYGPIEARLDKAKEGPQGANLWITIGITEGKNREVRRVLEHLGLTVNRLIRLAYGPFSLGTLQPGDVEEVGPRVIRELLSEHIAPESLPAGDRTPRPASRALAAVPSRRRNGRREPIDAQDPDPAATATPARPGFGKGRRRDPERQATLIEARPARTRGARTAEPKHAPAGPRGVYGKTPRSKPASAEAHGASREPALATTSAKTPRTPAGKSKATAAQREETKLTYKPGWAKPKRKPVAKPKPGGSRARAPKPAASNPAPPRGGRPQR